MALKQLEILALHVGQELYLSRSHRHQTGSVIIIERIGRKYAYTDRLKISLESGAIVSEFSNTYGIWINEQTYKKEAELTSAWDKFRRECANTFKHPAGLSVELIKEISDKLGFNPDKF